MIAERAPVSIREYRTEDEDGVLALLHRSLGDGRAFDRTSAFWQWKHFQNPFGPSLMMLAVDTDTVLGLRAFMRWQFRVGARTLMAVRAVDTATHPAYRRHGIFATLTNLTVERAQREGIELIFNTPNRFSLPGYLKLGWTYVGRPHLLVRILRPARIAWALGRRSATTTADDPVPRGPIAPVEMLLSRTDALEPLLSENDRLCADAIRTDRSVAYLQWRYLTTPSLSYYACWRGAEVPTALAIFRPNRRRGLQEVMVCELLLSRAGVRDVPTLIRGLVQGIEADYLVAHAAWGSVHWRALLGAGFIPIPRMGPHFTVRSLAPAPLATTPTRLAPWHLSLGDLEVF